MRALMLADGSFSWRERLMLTRLEVGLADIGVHVTRADPEREDRRQHVAVGLTSASITYQRIGLLNAPRSQAQALVHQLAQLKPSPDDAPVDVVYAFGEDCWTLAIETANQLDAACALELWSKRSIELIPKTERRCERAGVQLLWLAPDEPIRNAALERGCSAPCRVSRWGVHTSDAKREWDPSRRARSIAIVTSGADTPAVIGALEGITRIVRSASNTLVFLDAKAMSDHDRVWRRAESLELLENLSVIPDMEARRELVLRCDLMLLPESRGEHRTLTLDAMASGMIVVAQRDPLVACLDESGPAVLVEDSDPGSWEDAIRSVLRDPETAQNAIDAGREFVRNNRRASDHAQALYDSMAWLIGRDSISITEAAKAPERRPSGA